MSSGWTHTAYLVTFLTSSCCIFIVLQPTVKHFAYSKCVWKFGFTVCDRILGVEGSYRLTLSILLFYAILSILTININKKHALKIHQEYWFWKLLLYTVTHVLGFLAPFSKLGIKVLFNVFLSFSILFMFPMFLLALDLAHAFRLRWLRWAKENGNEATCYMCTWLFLIHVTTSIMYAVSLLITLAFFFFNDVNKCTSSFLLLFINLSICVFCVCISYAQSLQEKKASSHIIFATLFFFVTYTTWMAVSDPDNERCNMYGTIFSGSLLESSVNLRALTSIVIELVILTSACYQHPGKSYTNSLLFDIISGDFAESSISIYSKYHLTMGSASCFFLLTVTNWYEPVYTILHHHLNSSPGISSAIYFEGYNRPRFILLCAMSSLLPLLYVMFMIISLVKSYMREKKEDRGTTEENMTKVTTSVYNYFTEITRENAINKLKDTNQFHPEKHVKNETLNVIPCFYIRNMEVSFWHFPRHVSQTYFNGRNGSNACTIIAIMIGRFFARSDIPFQNQGNLHDQWFSLIYNSISEGNRLYDAMVKDCGVLDLSIEEVYTRLGPKLNMFRVFPSLAVSFESEVESATTFFQLDRLVKHHRKQVVLFIYKCRTSAFLIYEDGSVFYADSHAFGSGGALVMACYDFNVDRLIKFIVDVLGYNDNKLSSLTVVEYEDRSKMD